MRVMFLGYKRKVARGAPALTVGKVYEVTKNGSSPKYIWVKNDRNVSVPYPASNFAEVIEDKCNQTLFNAGVGA